MVATSSIQHALKFRSLFDNFQVRVLDVEREESVGDSDVLVMATDGLWDVVNNAAVAEVVKSGLKLYEDADETRRRYRHISIAQASAA